MKGEGFGLKKLICTVEQIKFFNSVHTGCGYNRVFRINLIRDFICGTPTISLPLIDLHLPVRLSLRLSFSASYHTFYIESFARPVLHARTPAPTQIHVMMPNKLQSYARPACCGGIMTWKSWNSTTIVVRVRTALWLVHSDASVTWRSAGPSPSPRLAYWAPQCSADAVHKTELGLTDHRNQDGPPAAPGAAVRHYTVDFHTFKHSHHGLDIICIKMLVKRSLIKIKAEVPLKTGYTEKLNSSTV